MRDRPVCVTAFFAGARGWSQKGVTTHVRNSLLVNNCRVVWSLAKTGSPWVELMLAAICTNHGVHALQVCILWTFGTVAAEFLSSCFSQKCSSCEIHTATPIWYVLRCVYRYSQMPLAVHVLKLTADWQRYMPIKWVWWTNVIVRLVYVVGVLCAWHHLDRHLPQSGYGTWQLAVLPVISSAEFMPEVSYTCGTCDFDVNSSNESTWTGLQRVCCGEKSSYEF